MKEEYLDIHF